jgi:putative transposase
VRSSEEATFWLHVLTELQKRWVKDSFLACVDGLKGLPEAIEALYPRLRCSRALFILPSGPLGM